jgi:signal transduction histidine kinase
MKDAMKNEIAVLLVEADDGHARLVQSALAHGGHYTVHRAPSLREALAALVSTPIDVVVADPALPDGRGVGAVAALRNQRRDLPLVVLTSLMDDAAATAALDHGAQDCLPIDGLTPDNLRRAIRHAMQRQSNLIDTERLLAELQLAQLQLEKKNHSLARLCRTAHRFVDNVSHEFRTPLTVIKEYGSLLRDGLLGEVNDEQRHFLDVLNDRSDDLNRMVDDMLDISKLGAGILGICRCNCQLRDILRRLQPGLERKALLKRIDFRVDVDKDLAFVYADPEKVGRVITNLVVNAFKFCGEPGVVRLSASQPAPGKQVRISVSDNGVGIRPEDMRKLFRRFKQVGSKGRAGAKGFGLGLNIARELVDLNFGTMQVSSEVGLGSVFSFTLPPAEPRHVIRRYLRALERQRHRPPQICLLAASIAADSPPPALDEVGDFLSGVLRRDDLLFRVEAGWQIVLACAQAEIEKFVGRAQCALEAANRNRPLGDLPPIVFEQQGCWSFPGQMTAFLRKFDQSHRAEAVHG